MGVLCFPGVASVSESITSLESRSPQKIFVTGASGCIGHYLVEQLLADTPHQLVLLVRNPAKLLFNWQDEPRIEVIQDDIRNIAAYADRLATVDTAILAATSWRSEEHTSELQSQSTISYAVFCLKKKKK